MRRSRAARRAARREEAEEEAQGGARAKQHLICMLILRRLVASRRNATNAPRDALLLRFYITLSAAAQSCLLPANCAADSLSFCFNSAAGRRRQKTSTSWPTAKRVGAGGRATGRLFRRHSISARSRRRRCRDKAPTSFIRRRRRRVAARVRWRRRRRCPRRMILAAAAGT